MKAAELAELLNEQMLEAEFQDGLIIPFARTHGWLVYHTYDSRRSEPGFPDLTLVRRGRVIFAEVKRQKGKVSVHQQAWLHALAGAGAEVYVWRPSDWEEIKLCLSR